MGNRAITEPLALTTDYVSIDGRYTAANGNPYASVAAAETALGRRMNQYTVGLTVLVKESGWTEAKEYWVQPKGTTPETYGLVEKGGKDLTKALTLSDEQKHNASANINDRAADVAPVTNEVRALGYKVLNPALGFSEQVENVVDNDVVIVDNSNTIFEIRDEFDLESGSVTIPTNCILKFNGGKLSGGTLTVNSIEAPRVKIFDDVTLANAPTNEVYPEWFGAVADGVTDCFTAMQAAVSCTNVTVKLGKGTYYCNGKLTPANNVVIEGHGRDLSTIQCNGIDMRTYNIIRNLTLKPINLQTEYLARNVLMIFPVLSIKQSALLDFTHAYPS